MDIRPANVLRPEQPLQPERPSGFSPEKPVTVEQRPEAPKPAERVGEGDFPLPAVTPQTDDLIISPASPEVQQIERIMEDGLAELYAQMPPDKQREFRRVGEQTARQINQLLMATKIQVTKIISLIKDWLKILPGINRFFIEQEAKIKTDELLKMRQPKP
ncbi:hypothetical protein HGA34_04200 [Candidatus Falkowbacteria bacterium]|nr:hypothetical protein [Candidatus Falkowbacteria bacterium]